MINVSPTAHVVFVDDEELSTRALISSLKRHGADFDCSLCPSASTALQAISEQRPEAAVVDLSLDPALGPESGLSLIDEILSLEPSVRILVLTGHDSVDWGVRALQSGAASFLVKPANSKHLLALLYDAISYAQLQRKYIEISASRMSSQSSLGLSSANSKMQKVLELAAFAAANKQPVLLLGETGTGKGVIAQAIHKASSSKGPFIRFQPTFTSAEFVSSELFGHQKGAFTGAIEHRAGLIEEANRGTLFLDELDELPKETQLLLLHVLQEHVFRRLGSNKELRSDFRLIAATNRPLDEILQQGKLRQDFYHRIAHLIIDIPSLRDRPEDIPLLASQFLTTLANRENLHIQGFTARAQKKLLSYPWPGNVRELQAKIEGCIYRASFNARRFVEPDDIDLAARRKGSVPPSSYRARVRQFELEMVRSALARHNNNQTKAAQSLGLERSMFRRVLARGQ